MKTIAWIGLGLIGLPMAARLASRGASVKGFDIDPQRLRMAEARGIASAPDLASAVADAELVFSSLPTEAALLEVANAASARMPREAVLIETSTVGPNASAQAARSLGAAGMAYLRAPISGSTALAETGSLTTFVSGPRATFDAVRPVLEAYSRAQIWLGEGEEARFAKLAVNLMVAVTAGMIGEALALGRKGGIGWNALLELVGESVVGSPLVKYKLEPLRRRDFTPAATNALVMKDLDLVVQAAAQAGVPVPLAQHMQAAYREMLAGELAAQDFFSVVKQVERAAGLGEPET
jgi:3-hydroxyisobutyrate dehydrogenase-like beta-hydroxyacid dehydrogenase